MITKLVLKKFGNSKGVILPAFMIKGYNIGDEIELDVKQCANIVDTIKPVNTEKVITPEIQEVPEAPEVPEIIPQNPVIKKIDLSAPAIPNVGKPRYELCSKHHGASKATCGCK